MSTDYDNGRKEGLREAGVIADRIADELEMSRCQLVATRIRGAIVKRMGEVAASPGRPPTERLAETLVPCPRQAADRSNVNE